MKDYIKCTKCWNLNKLDTFKERTLVITASLAFDGKDTYEGTAVCMKCKQCKRILFQHIHDYKRLCTDAESFFCYKHGNDFIKLVNIKIKSE